MVNFFAPEVSPEAETSSLKPFFFHSFRVFVMCFIMASLVGKVFDDLFVVLVPATVPGLYLWGSLTPPVAGADLRAALVASCFLGAFPPVDFLAVCLVLAIVIEIIVIA